MRAPLLRPFFMRGWSTRAAKHRDPDRERRSEQCLLVVVPVRIANTLAANAAQPTMTRPHCHVPQVTSAAGRGSSTIARFEKSAFASLKYTKNIATIRIARRVATHQSRAPGRDCAEWSTAHTSAISTLAISKGL
ncbi:MAG: hypothetical protein ACI9OJ_005736 [Myxococcota bacterium]|jgi:hypothetical protein